MIAYFCVEDALSRAVLSRLLYDLLGRVNLIELQPNQGGFGSIKKKFSNYCVLAQHHHVFILTDLDRAECAPSLRQVWMHSAKLTEPLPSKMCFNIAVAEIEAWLIADHANISEYLGIPAGTFPNDSEIADPKEFLLNCVRRHGNRSAKMELLPSGAASIGLGYNAHLSKFASERWDFNSAARRNASLSRAIAKIESVREAASHSSH